MILVLAVRAKNVMPLARVRTVGRQNVKCRVEEPTIGREQRAGIWLGGSL